MRTFAILLLAAIPCSAFAQALPLSPWPNDNYRFMPPGEIDPYQVFIYERPLGSYATEHFGDICIVLMAIKETGEYVRIAGSMQLCGHPFAKGMEMNFSPRLLLPDSVQ